MGSVAGIFYSVWLLTTFYMAWFYFLFGFIFVFIILLSGSRYQFWNFKKIPFITIFIPIFFTIISLIPFLMVYLSTAQETGMHPYQDAQIYLPKITNLINIGNQNLMWGMITRYLHFQPDAEAVVGYPFFFLGILIFAMVYCLKSTSNNSTIFYRPLTYSIIISILVSVAIFDFSFWYVIWKFFPGAKGLRVIFRYWIYLFFPMSILISYYLSMQVIRPLVAICFLIPALLILEQINMGHINNLNIKDQQILIDSAKLIPAQCQVFYVTGTRYKNIPINLSMYLNNVDAMMISELTGIRTINGASTFNPPDWNFGYFPTETYRDRIQSYIQKHKIKNLCSFDLVQKKWDTNETAIPLPT